VKGVVQMAKKEKASKKSEKAKKPAKKEAGEKKEKKDKTTLEGLTKETKETGVISFKKGSGSSDLLKLIEKNGFNREKVLKEAAKLKEKGKAFEDCDPVKKYNKVAGIIKKLQKAGYKLNLAKDAED
jgi:hypothetical protein